MKKYSISTLLSTITTTMLLCACGQVYYYHPADHQPEPTRQANYHGVPNLTGDTGECIVTAEMRTVNSENFLDVGLFVYNKTDKLLPFSPDSVIVYGFAPNGNKRALKVLTARDYLDFQGMRAEFVNHLFFISAVDISGLVHEPDFVPAHSASVTPRVAPDGLLRSHTLAPQEGVAGIIKVEKNNAFKQSYLIEVPVNGRYVKFVFGKRTRL